MQNDDSDGSSVITFKQRTRYTNIDYRDKLSLNAKDISKLMILSSNIDEQEEFSTIIIALITIISIIQNDDQLNSHSEDEMSFNSISLSLDNSLDESVFSGFTTFASDSSSDSSNDSSTDSSNSNSTVSSISSNEDDTISSSSSISSESTSSSSTLSDFSTSSDEDSFLSPNDFLINFDDDNNELNNILHSISHQEFESFESNKSNDSVADRYCKVIATFAMILGCSIMDIDMFVLSIIDITVITRREWMYVRLSTNSQKKNRTIQELGPMCYHLTRFAQNELTVLYNLFFGKMLESTYTFCDIRFSYEETLLIALDYMSNGTKFITMSHAYGGDWTRYSYMVNFFAKFLFHK